MTTEIPAGYKQTSVGIIPEDWEVKKLGKIAKINSGGTPLREKSEYWNGNIPWITTSLLNQSSISFAEEFITDLALKNSAAKMFNVGTLLMAMYGQGQTRGKVSKLQINAATNQACAGIEIISNCSEYYYQLLNSKYEVIRNLSNNGSQQNLSLDLIKNINVSVPPLPEQQKIAEILSTWDKAIETCRKTIEELKPRNKGLAQQLLSGKIANSENAYKDYHVIGKYVREVSKRNTSLQEKRILSVTNSRGFINQSEQFGRELASADLSNYKIVEKGQFAYNPSRVNVGSLDLLRSFDSGVLSPMYVVFEVSSADLLPEFLFYHLKTNWFTGHIPMFVQGSVRDTLLFDGFSGMKFYIPNLNEQKRIVEVLDTAVSELKRFEEKLQNLKLQKKGLMQVLLTGKVRTI